MDGFLEKNHCKIVIGGDGAVGKTTVAQKLAGNLKVDEDRTMTPGIDFHSLNLADEEIIHANIWDLGGQEQFRPFQQSFLEGAHIAIFVFSVEWYYSFFHIKHWIEMIDKNTTNRIYLIANKIDFINRAVTSEEANDFAEKYNMKYYDVSAITGKGFEKFKQNLFRTIIKIFKDPDEAERFLSIDYMNAKSQNSFSNDTIDECTLKKDLKGKNSLDEN